MCTTASNTSIQCSQAEAMCTQAEQFTGTGCVHRRLSNARSMCTISIMQAAWSAHPGQGCYKNYKLQLTRLHLRFYQEHRKFFGADRPFKVKSSSLWAAYSLLDSWSLTTAIKLRLENHSRARQQHIDSKIYRIELKDVVALDLHYVEVFSAYLLAVAEK